jgi:hypothetical protein
MSEVPTRLLRDALRAHAAQPPKSRCVDEDALAAWADDTLDAKSRAAVESHAADCARCQAMLAAMAKTAPALSAPQPARRRRSLFAWLVPVAATAAAVIVWLAAPAEKPALAPPPDRTVAAAPLPVAVSPPAAVRPPVQPRGQVSSPRQAPARESARQMATRPVTSPESPPAAQSIAPAAPLAEATAAAVPAPPTPSVADDAIAGFGARSGLAMKAVAVAPRINAPDGRTAWRLTPNGGVERTTDGGLTWTAQATGVAATLTAGAAPSATVCWLVGPAGIVVLSDDGRSWRRIAFPETIDLRSIRASDDKSATVSAVDGRTFATRDGGQTWTR